MENNCQQLDLYNSKKALETLNYNQTIIHNILIVWLCFWCRYVGFSRPGPDAAEVPVCAYGSRVGARGTEAQVEVAADPAEQRGLL